MVFVDHPTHEVFDTHRPRKNRITEAPRGKSLQFGHGRKNPQWAENIGESSKGGTGTRGLVGFLTELEVLIVVNMLTGGV